MKPKILIGLGILALVAIIFGVLLSLPKPAAPVTPTPVPTLAPATQMKVLGGLMLQDAEVVKYLRDSYNIDIVEQMTGSFAQAEADLTGVSCVWPGSVTAYDYFVEKHPDLAKKYSHATIFQSYLMIYTWQDYLPALQKAGLVTDENGVHFIKVRPLIDAMAQGKTWAEIGVNDIPGLVNLESTDPLKSSSGMVWMTMMADYLAEGGEHGGKVVNINTLPPTLDTIYKYWDAQGRQSASTPELFTAFIRSGKGRPMILSYESSFLEFYSGLPEAQKTQASSIVGLYPEVTVNTEHVLVSTSPECEQLVKIFQEDQWLKDYAWSRFGMRNAQGKPGDSAITWVADSVRSMSEPKKNVVDAIKAVLK